MRGVGRDQQTRCWSPTEAGGKGAGRQAAGWHMARGEDRHGVEDAEGCHGRPERQLALAAGDQGRPASPGPWDPQGPGSEPLEDLDQPAPKMHPSCDWLWGSRIE